MYPAPITPQASYDDDARAIVVFTLEHGAAPLLAPLVGREARLDRAIARAVASIRRTDDEHAPSVAAINRAIDVLSGARQAIRAADRLATITAPAPAPAKPSRPGARVPVGKGPSNRPPVGGVAQPF